MRFFSAIWISLIFFSLIVACSPAKQLLLDPSFESNSERWKPVVKSPDGLSDFLKISLGSFRTLSISKLDSAALKTYENDAGPFQLFFSANKTKTKQKMYKLNVCNESDSAEIIVLVKSDNKISQPSFLLRGKDAKEETISDNRTVSGIIYCHHIAQPWTFNVGPFSIGQGGESDVNRIVSGYLENGMDSLNIGAVKEFTRKYHLISGYNFESKGIILTTKDGKYIGALQLFRPYYVWICKDIPGEYQIIAEALFSIMVATRDFPPVII